MGYHTHFYAYDKNKQNEWAKEILTRYKERLLKKLDKIPSDAFFKKIYQCTLEMVSDERIKEQRENAKKYGWPQSIIDSNEAFYTKHRDPNYTWETEKQEWIDRLERIKELGLLSFEDEPGINFPADFLIGNWDAFEFLSEYNDPQYEVREGKLYSGEIFKCYYRVKGRYCQSMWFNPNGVIEMVEDYVDTTKTTKTGKHPKLKLTKEEKQKIEQFFKDYPDSYCWII